MRSVAGTAAPRARTGTTSERAVATRAAGRSRALPGSRAVLGGLLVAVAALGTFAAARGAGATATRSFVVAARDVPAGSVLSPADLTSVAMHLPDASAARAFTDAGPLVGRVTVAPLAKGELVQTSAVVGGDAADERVQLSVPVDRARALDGLLQVGEKVDVLATYGEGADGRTLVVARDAEVRRVDNGSRGSITASDNSVIVLAVADGDEALAVTHASQTGKVTLLRSTRSNGPSSDSYTVTSSNATGR